MEKVIGIIGSILLYPIAVATWVVAVLAHLFAQTIRTAWILGWELIESD